MLALGPADHLEAAPALIWGMAAGHDHRTWPERHQGVPEPHEPELHVQLETLKKALARSSLPTVRARLAQRAATSAASSL